MAGDKLTRGDIWMIAICTAVVVALDIVMYVIRLEPPHP